MFGDRLSVKAREALRPAGVVVSLQPPQEEHVRRCSATCLQHQISTFLVLLSRCDCLSCCRSTTVIIYTAISHACSYCTTLILAIADLLLPTLNLLLLLPTLDLLLPTHDLLLPTSTGTVTTITTTRTLWESNSCANLIDVDVTVFHELIFISRVGGCAAAAAAWRCRALCPSPSCHNHDRICFCCFGITTTTTSLWESISCVNLIYVDVTVFQELEYISKIGGGAAAAAWCVCPKPRLLQPGTLLNRWQHCLLSNMQPGYRFP